MLTRPNLSEKKTCLIMLAKTAIVTFSVLIGGCIASREEVLRITKQVAIMLYLIASKSIINVNVISIY